MSGIVGIWNLDRRPVEPALLNRMRHRLAHRGGDGEAQWIQGAVGLACQLFRVTPEAAGETQPLVHSSGVVLVFDGRLDNRDEILTLLPTAREVSATSPDPDLILAAYLSFGERFVERLNGDFAFAIYDPRQPQLVLARDAIGVRPLYYCRVADTFLFASEIKGLLVHPAVEARPNDELLATYLLGGVPDSTRESTFFDNVFSVLPAHVVTVTANGLAKRRYWDFDPARRLRLGSFEEYAEGFRHHFEQAVRRRCRSAHPVAISVSGGLDSSPIFCVAESLRRRIPGPPPAIVGIAYTRDDGSIADERSYLGEIERAYGLAIRQAPVGPLGFLEGQRDAIWHAESPLVDGMWNNTRAHYQRVHDCGARVLLTGHWGDQLLVELAYLADLFRRLAWREVWKHLNEFPQWLTDADPRYFRQRFLYDLVAHLFPGALIPIRSAREKLAKSARHRGWYAEKLRNRVRTRTQRGATPGFFATAQSTALYRTYRSRNQVLYAEWQNKVGAMIGLEMAFPYLDRDLIAFMIATPGEVQQWQGVPRAIQREALRGVLPDAIASRRWKADFTHLVQEGMAQEYPRVVEQLLSDSFAVRLGYVDDRVIREHLTPTTTRTPVQEARAVRQLLDLLALDVWLNVFFADEPNRTEGRDFERAGATV